MILYNVTDNNGNYLMTAPLETVLAIFTRHPKIASQRILREVEGHGNCELHFNGRVTEFGPKVTSVVVTAA